MPIDKKWHFIMISDFILDEEDIKKDQEIAKGYFGTTYKGTISESGKDVVVCEISKEDIWPGRGSKHIFRELDILVKLDHPFVNKLVGFIPINSSSNYHKVVYEYIPNGTLGDVAKQAEKKNAPSWYNGTAKTKIAYGIAVAMAYIHSNHVIHRFLKPENVLLDENYNPIIKFFGFAKFIKSGEENTLSIGTPLFLAPEIIVEDANYGLKVDVFAYSILLFSILTNKTNPYDRIRTVSELYQAVTAGERPVFPENFANTKIVKLIRRCWDKVPETGQRLVKSSKCSRQMKNSSFQDVTY